MYLLTSGFCCCCVLTVICGCGKSKSDYDVNGNKGSKTVTCIGCWLKFLAAIIHVVWIILVLIFMVIPVLTMFMIVVLALILSLGVLCFLCCYHEKITQRLKEILNILLTYEVHHDTHAAAILKKNWEGIQKYPHENEKEKGCAPNHVIISFDDA